MVESGTRLRSKAVVRRLGTLAFALGCVWPAWSADERVELVLPERRVARPPAVQREGLLALRGASEGLKEKIYSNMSKRAAEILRDDMEASPPAKLSDVEGAQKEILTTVKQLLDSGEIQLGNEGGDELI